jgi:hypothetical protein
LEPLSNLGQRQANLVQGAHLFITSVPLRTAGLSDHGFLSRRLAQSPWLLLLALREVVSEFLTRRERTEMRVPSCQ